MPWPSGLGWRKEMELPPSLGLGNIYIYIYIYINMYIEPLHGITNLLPEYGYEV